MKENKARKHARALQSQSTELTIYTDLTPTCYFVKVIASPIDQVDRVVEGALAKDGFLIRFPRTVRPEGRSRGSKKTINKAWSER